VGCPPPSDVGTASGDGDTISFFIRRDSGVGWDVSSKHRRVSLSGGGVKAGLSSCLEGFQLDTRAEGLIHFGSKLAEMVMLRDHLVGPKASVPGQEKIRRITTVRAADLSAWLRLVLQEHGKMSGGACPPCRRAFLRVMWAWVYKRV